MRDSPLSNISAARCYSAFPVAKHDTIAFDIPFSKAFCFRLLAFALVFACVFLPLFLLALSCCAAFMFACVCRRLHVFVCLRFACSLAFVLY